MDANDAKSNWVALQSEGVSDILVLPDGTPVALEKALGNKSNQATQERVRLYAIDWSSATNLNGGSAGGATPVKKTLLWEMFTNNNNLYEGITLGPTLSNGDVSIIMSADNNGGNKQTL
jgi:hypothetical protein